MMIPSTVSSKISEKIAMPRLTPASQNEYLANRFQSNFANSILALNLSASPDVITFSLSHEAITLCTKRNRLLLNNISSPPFLPRARMAGHLAEGLFIIFAVSFLLPWQQVFPERFLLRIILPKCYQCRFDLDYYFIF